MEISLLLAPVAFILWASLAYILYSWRGENQRTRFYTSIHVDLTEPKGRRARRMREQSTFSGNHLPKSPKTELKGPVNNPFKGK